LEAPLIAIVEDDDAVLGMIAECLKAEGYRTFSHRRGAGAYELIEHSRPDAVVLDIRLEHPRAGMAVLQRLRHDPATAVIPVLVCTADVPFTREWGRTLAEHRCAVVTKPFLIDDLLAALARLIDPPLDDPAPTRGGYRRIQETAEPVVRPVVGLVDANGKGVISHTAQLEQKGYKVVACRWGDGIFDMALCEQPDMLIVDPGDRPRGAVSYALRRLGRNPLTGHIPIVVDPPDGEFYRRVEEVVGPASAFRPATRRA
jgi:CheY-like chemotaxis protein